jgi:hypothetical protein
MPADSRLAHETVRRVGRLEFVVTDSQSPQQEEEEREKVGLCCDCRQASVQRSARGSAFWRCRLSDANPEFMRYPPLPVRACQGFESEP